MNELVTEAGSGAAGDMSQADGPGKAADYSSLPAEIYIPLVDALYSDVRSLYIGSAAASLAAALVALKNGEWLIYLCAAAVLLVTALRAIDMRAYQRVRPSLTDMAQVRAKGVPSYGLGATRSIEEINSGNGAHGDNERVSEESVKQLIQFVWYTIIDIGATRR